MTSARLLRWTEPAALEQLEAWARSGLSRERIAARMGVRDGTLRRWRRREPALDEALSRGEGAYWQVEAAVFRLATGYTHPVRKHVKLHHVEYDPNGRKIRDDEELVPITEEAFVAPSVTAGVFWLNNRRPEDLDALIPPESLLPNAAQALLTRAKREEADEEA